MDKSISKKQFLNMLRWSLEMAPITNKVLAGQVDQFHKELSSDETLVEENYYLELDKKIAGYLFSNYNSLVLTRNEKVIGINDNGRIELFDATDTKAYLDL